MFFNKYIQYIAFIFVICGTLRADDFVVGTASGYAPFVSVNVQGEYEGFDVDLARLIAERLEKKLVLKDLGGLSSLFLALERNKIDAIIWAVSITQPRLKQMDMVYYQGEKVETLPILFWETIPEEVRTIEDIARNPQAVVCVEAGSFQEKCLQRVSGLNLKQVDSITDALLEIRYNKAIATAIDPSLLTRVMQQYPQLRVMQMPLLPDEQALGNGICLNKKNGDLQQRISQIVAELRDTGKIKELEEKWGLA